MDDVFLLLIRSLPQFLFIARIGEVRCGVILFIRLCAERNLDIFLHKDLTRFEIREKDPHRVDGQHAHQEMIQDRRCHIRHERREKCIEKLYEKLRYEHDDKHPALTSVLVIVAHHESCTDEYQREQNGVQCEQVHVLDRQSQNLLFDLLRFVETTELHLEAVYDRGTVNQNVVPDCVADTEAESNGRASPGVGFAHVGKKYRPVQASCRENRIEQGNEHLSNDIADPRQKPILLDHPRGKPVVGHGVDPGLPEISDRAVARREKQALDLQFLFYM